MFEKMKGLIREKDICVLATVSENAVPHCSLMAYVSDDACREIYMATRKSTMKYKNLLNNPAVSLLIDSRDVTPRENAQALTISGIFEPIDDAAKRDRVEAGLLKRHPHLNDFIGNPDTALIGIRVKSLLLLCGLTESHFLDLETASSVTSYK